MKPRPQNPLTDYRKLCDEDVVHRYVHRHESHALACLYDRYAHLVLGVCFKYLKDPAAAQDATQQIFIKLLDDLKRFQIVQFRPWLMQVTRNYCLMQLRGSLQVHHNTIALPEELPFEDETSAYRQMDYELLLQSLEAALGTLSEAQKQCVTLFYLEKKSYAQIAALTGFTMLEVKSHIQNGRRNLKIKLTHNNNNATAAQQS